MSVKTEREARGWSQLELARRARLSPATVSLIESNRLVPYEAQLRKLAKALSLTTGQIDDLRKTTAARIAAYSAEAH